MKKIRVFNHPWHLGHQHSLMKLPFVEWDWLIQYKRPFHTKPRGDFPVNWVTHYEPGKYDVALLHIDNQCVDKEIAERGKGRLYRELNEVITDIPKIVINHGTYYYPEKFTTEELVRLTKEAVGDNTMVVNSYKAAEQWGFGTPIIHGMSPEEWWDLPKEPKVVTMLSPGGLDMYYDRQFLESVKDLLFEKHGIQLCQITTDWIAENWDDYRQFLGRSLVYFNPTRESPMPRSRTEAMLSGCCVITTPHQDADRFIKDGENGFIIPRNPEVVVEKIMWCLNHYDEAVAIGQKGKQTAIEQFHIDRYAEDWRQLFSKVLGYEVGKE